MIRAYHDDDLRTLLDVWYQASLLAHPFLDAAFLSQERATIAKVYMPMADTWVYVREGRVVGFISLLGHEVGALFVDPPVQGRGIGRALMDHARASRELLEVDVFKANRMGRRFYKACGFTLEREHVHEQTGLPLLRLQWRGG